MIRDPLTRWHGVFPYDALASAGITPMSTQTEVLDASYDLMAKGLMTPEVRRAWDELRLLPKRLLVDLFLYPLDLPAELQAALADLEAELRDPPERLDVTELLTLDRSVLDGIGTLRGDLAFEPVTIDRLEVFDTPPAMLDEFDIEFDR